jgi:hypothetical protein
MADQEASRPDAPVTGPTDPSEHAEPSDPTEASEAAEAAENTEATSRPRRRIVALGVVAVVAVLAVVVVVIGSRDTTPSATGPTTTPSTIGEPEPTPTTPPTTTTTIAPSFTLPAEGDVLAGLRPEHPRLLITPAEVVALRQRIETDPTTAAMYTKVRARADALLDEPVLTYEKPEGRGLLDTSRAAMARLYDLGLVWLVDQDPTVAERGAAELEAISAFPDWNPTRFLDTAEMSHAVAIGYDWLHDALTPAQRTAIATAIADKVLTPARAAYTGTAPPELSDWATYDNNWTLVTSGGVALGALAIAEQKPVLAGQTVHEAVARAHQGMRHYGPDGGWPEGMGYWTYATSYAGALVAGLDTALGTDFGLSTQPGFAITGEVPAQLTGPTGNHANWADDAAPGTPEPLPFLFWTAERFDRPQDRALQLARNEAAALDVVWYRPSTAPVGEPPLDRFFRGIDAVSLRQRWDDPDSWWVAVKGGRPWMEHNQLDAGSFVLEAMGERWAVELGHEDYRATGYWDLGPDGRRWDYFRSRAESHNTLVLDPDACEDQDPTATSAVTRFRSAADGAYTIVDLTGAYRGIPVRRGVGLLDGRDQVVVQDELLAPAGTALRWHLHTRAEVERSADGRTATLTQGGKTLRASIVGLPGATFSVGPAAPLPSSNAATTISNRGVRRLAISTTVSGAVAFAVVFDDGEGPAPTNVTPLDRWQVGGGGLVAEDAPAVTQTPAPNACKPIAE